MKVVLLSGASSIHTIRWANGLVGAGCHVLLVTQQPLCQTVDDRVQVEKLPMLGAAGYYLYAWKLRGIIKRFQPDIINAHYASGYGTLARMAGCHPLLLNVWGSDVYDFPKKSRLHAQIVRKNLRAADAVASTSHIMLEETKQYLPAAAESFVIPFGVETEKFALDTREKLPNTDEIVIGTVKKLEPTYGIDTLIQAFKFLLDSELEPSAADSPPQLTLRIVGYGGEQSKLEELVSQLGIREQVVFVGKVPNEAVPEELAKMDIFAALSRRESFGVSVVEAGAARLPSVVSDVDGFKEVVIDGETGIIVPREDPAAAAAALMQLITAPEFAKNMGRKARAHVQTHYEWRKNVEAMINAYHATIQGTCK